jgi:hypothetical protein
MNVTVPIEPRNLSGPIGVSLITASGRRLSATPSEPTAAVNIVSASSLQ